MSRHDHAAAAALEESPAPERRSPPRRVGAGDSSSASTSARPPISTPLPESDEAREFLADISRTRFRANPEMHYLDQLVFFLYARADAGRRLRARRRARAAMRRRILRLPSPELAAQLTDEYGVEAPSLDALYQWVRRGREIVVRAIDARLEDPRTPGHERRRLRLHREIFAAARRDAGRPRPERRSR
ncbi:MAG: hypothetical protein RLP09_32375 [Sandaracinaceae bacterium]